MGEREYDGRRPRIPVELAQRIDALRGGVPFNRWIEERLDEVASAEEPRADNRARKIS